MIKAHVQIPDDLYHSAKKVAENKEWSFAEVVRRGVEYMTTINQSHEIEVDWDFPLVKNGRLVSEEALNEALNEVRDSEWRVESDER